MKTRINICFAIGILLLLTTCGDNNPTSTTDDDPVDPNVESKEIGPAGGNLTSKDGLVTLEIPAGALSGSETITIEKITADDLGSEFENIDVQEAYELGPDGLEFDVPVLVSFAENQNPVVESDSLEMSSVSLLSSENGEVFFLDNSQTIVDSDEGTTMGTGEISHFSPLVKTRGALTLRVGGLRDEVEVSTNFFDVFVGGEVDLNKFDRDSVLIAAGPEAPLEVEEGSGLQKLVLLSGAYIQNVRHRCPEVGNGRFIIGVSIESIEGQSGEFIQVKSDIECVPATSNLQVLLDGNGSGSVSSNPEGIDCPEDCTEDYSENTLVELTATPDEGSAFTVWSEFGVEISNNPVIEVTMDQARTLTATFDVSGGSEGIFSSGTGFPREIMTVPNPWGDLTFPTDCPYVHIVAGADVGVVDPCSGSVISVLDIPFEVSSTGLNGGIALSPVIDNLLLLTSQSGWFLAKLGANQETGEIEIAEFRGTANNEGFIYAANPNRLGGTEDALITSQFRTEKLSADLSQPGGYADQGEFLVGALDKDFNPGNMTGEPRQAYTNFSDNTPGSVTGVASYPENGSRVLRAYHLKRESDGTYTENIGPIVGAVSYDFTCQDHPDETPAQGEADRACLSVDGVNDEVHRILIFEDESNPVQVLPPISTTPRPFAIDSRLTLSGEIDFTSPSFSGGNNYRGIMDFTGTILGERLGSYPSELDGIECVRINPSGDDIGMIALCSRNNDLIGTIRFLPPTF
ncbi:InlB B-repeat-containing protein [Rhodohalobacter mucosus]|uniref:Bacterial repeat domain-containing protein n=1 Tax=Rhodohalobacter mucosus TaxID=2079485 RepID=A0A316TYM2_9BACT|nr:hypothetical protein [Rhodohalobacter mucosus]PWN07904.1 hypothetical protein DDZ15_02525 [Rhodohalobacter mucosus]